MPLLWLLKVLKLPVVWLRARELWMEGDLWQMWLVRGSGMSELVRILLGLISHLPLRACIWCASSVVLKEMRLKFNVILYFINVSLLWKRYLMAYQVFFLYKRPQLPFVAVPLSMCLENQPSDVISWGCSRKTRNDLRPFGDSSCCRSSSFVSRRSTRGSYWQRDRSALSSRRSKGDGWKR